MNEVEAAQQSLIDDFAFFDNWMDRYQYIIDLGRRLPDFPEELRTEENRIRGCQSQVWLYLEGDADEVIIRANSDAAIVAPLIFGYLLDW